MALVKGFFHPMSIKIDLNKLSRKDLIKKVVELERETSYLTENNRELSSKNASLADDVQRITKSHDILAERVEMKHISIISLQERMLAQSAHIKALEKAIDARIKGTTLRGRIRSKYSREYAAVRDGVLAGRKVDEDLLVELCGLGELDHTELLKVYEEFLERPLTPREASNLTVRLTAASNKRKFEVKATTSIGDVFALEEK